MKKVEPMQPGLEDDPHFNLLRTVRTCHPAWDTVSAITLSADVRSVWIGDIFEPVLRPQLMAAFLAAAAGNERELEKCDLELDRELPAQGAAASRLAGGMLMENFPAPPAEKPWARYQRKVTAGDSAGHLAVVLAIRAAAFHLPCLSVVPAYVFLEACGGLPRMGIPVWMEVVEQCCPPGGPATVPQIRAA
jgi:hypothetical protein